MHLTKQPDFPTSYEEIVDRIASIDPIRYASSRNYTNGAVSYLSPYISRGVISARQVMSYLIDKGYAFHDIEKFIQELAWRDYWQRVWQSKKDEINYDLKQPQKNVRSHKISKAIVRGQTSIEAIDNAIAHFYETGYLHNHVRMYIAAIACNVGGNHWKLPAQWMYYHLLDADWASNALSWQWVAGSNSHKKYYANQENINTYCGTAQHGTFLDVAYSNFESLGFPAQLAETELLNLITELPPKNKVRINEVLPTCIYNAYNLDPLWLKNLDANRVLLLEPSHFKAYPMSKKSIDFILALSENISNIQVFVGEFSEFANNVQEETLHYKEHPLNNHYKGIMTARDWMTQVEGYYPSFFKFWKLSKKELQLLFNNHIK